MKENLLRDSKILQAVHRLSPGNQEKIYLVGGAIRDFLLGRPVGKDFDFVAAGEVSDLARRLAAATGGHAFSVSDSFGTWRVVLKLGKEKIDVDFSPMQGGDIGEDLKQRDFTINSIGLSLEEILGRKHPPFIDPLHGLSDLRRRVLRVNSEESLVRDPLRMLRGYRLVHTLGLKVDENTLKLIQKHKKLILLSAWERMRSEFFAALNERQASWFLKDLHQSGLLGEIFPEIQGWESYDAGFHHGFPLLVHALRTVEAGEILFAHFEELSPTHVRLLDQHFSATVEEGISREGLFKFVAFFHDSGKPRTKSLGSDGQVRFLDHDQEGQRINLILAQRMKLSRKSVRIISELTRQHMRILSLAKAEEATPRAKYRFFRELGKEGIDAVFLALADGLASSRIDLGWPLVQELPGDLGKIRGVAEEFLRYYFEEFSRKPPRPLLDGREIMEAFKLPPGEGVGRLLDRLREAEMTGLVRTREGALEFLKNLDSSRPFGYYTKKS